MFLDPFWSRFTLLKGQKLKSGCGHSILVGLVQFFGRDLRYYRPKTYQKNKVVWDTFVIWNTLTDTPQLNNCWQYISHTICTYAFLYLCTCIFRYDTSEYHFWHPLTELLSKIQHVPMLFAFGGLYFCICVFVFCRKWIRMYSIVLDLWCHHIVVKKINTRWRCLPVKNDVIY